MELPLGSRLHPIRKGYDPICFDTSARTENDDYKIVKIAHEQILCNNRVEIVAELAPSFEQLMLDTIDRANRTGQV